MEAGTLIWLVVVALVLSALALATSIWALAEIRAWRREDQAWKTHFGGRFTAVESRILGTTLPETPPLRPAFVIGRDSAEPSYGSPPGSIPVEVERTTWVPPSRSRKKD